MLYERNILAIVGGAMGVVLVVIGLVALARTGLPVDDLTGPTASVGPFERTPLMALIEIVAGLLVIAAAVSGDRAALVTVGLLALIFGIVWLIEPGAFADALGAGMATAVLYLLLGIVAIVAGMIAWRGGAAVQERTYIER
jgi:hypothetical protein